MIVVKRYGSRPRVSRSSDGVAFETRARTLVADHHPTLQRVAAVSRDHVADKSAVILRDLEAARDEAAARLDQHLKDLGYA